MTVVNLLQKSKINEIKSILDIVNKALDNKPEDKFNKITKTERKVPKDPKLNNKIDLIKQDLAEVKTLVEEFQSQLNNATLPDKPPQDDKVLCATLSPVKIDRLIQLAEKINQVWMELRMVQLKESIEMENLLATLYKLTDKFKSYGKIKVSNAFCLY